MKRNRRYRSMADMHDSGVYSFNSFMNPDRPYLNRWLGEANADMMADEANQLLDHVGKISDEGQAAFKRGWREAQEKYAKALQI